MEALTSPFTTILISLPVAYLFVKWFNAPTHRVSSPKTVSQDVYLTYLKHIPTIGHSGFFLSFIDAWRFKTGRARDMIQEGYDRVRASGIPPHSELQTNSSVYYGSAFKVPTFFEWIVFVSGPQLTDELRRAGDDHLFFVEFVNEVGNSFSRYSSHRII
ncbi:LOW QUALITY PROTEIN: hypothetical protein CVT26_012616 [Gymnopilus dilepis]|uniref:Uncharacterized protein n=1 Tax=Gymnopilus dilepis TaxID=231916 RepID=A0A409YVY7_9AGAR|nr:LOW QUALITY PROTEIN: hypothetical protein CVT26_012616 [Gymnopilus dilepis]